MSSVRAEFDDTWRRLGWTVVGAKLRAARNRVAVTRRKSPVRTTAQIAVLVPCMLLIVGLISVGFSSAVSGIDDASIATTMLGSMIAIFALGSFVGTSTTALQALYLADDIPFLMTLPIPLRALFGGKFVEAAAGALPPAMLFISCMLGFGWDRAHHPMYWLFGPVIGISVALIATSVSVGVVSLVTRFIPPQRARLFLFAISLALTSLTLFGWRALAPRPEALGEVVNRAEYEPLRMVLSVTPIGWGAEAMSAAAAGYLGHASLYGALVAVSAFVAVSLSFRIFRHTFIRSLAQTRDVQTTAPNAALARWLGVLASPLPGEVGALVLKEWLVFFRDLRRLAGAIWPVGIVLVYAIVLGRGTSPDLSSDELEFWSRNGVLALLPWGLSLGISVYSYGSEGRNVQLLRALPISPTKHVLSKVLASSAIVAAIGMGAATVSLWFRGAPMLQAAELLGVLLWMVIGFVTIDTTAAALAPNFETDQVQRTIGLTGRLYSVVVGGIFALATVAAAGRLVLMGDSPPESLADVLATSVGGVAPFGWPLVVAAAVTALTAVVASALLAIQQTERIILARP